MTLVTPHSHFCELCQVIELLEGGTLKVKGQIVHIVVFAGKSSHSKWVPIWPCSNKILSGVCAIISLILLTTILILQLKHTE